MFYNYKEDAIELKLSNIETVNNEEFEGNSTSIRYLCCKFDIDNIKYDVNPLQYNKTVVGMDILLKGKFTLYGPNKEYKLNQ